MFYFMIAAFLIGYCLIALEHPIKINKSATALILGVLIWVLYIFAGDGIYAITHFSAGYDAFKAANPDSPNPFIDFVVNNELLVHLGDIAEILFFLMGAMTIVELIDSFQGFRIITDHITTKNRVKLLWVLGFITFFLSAVLDNLTTAIVMIALLRKLISDKHDRWFFAGIIIIAANAGGAWSPIGDVTTIMLWIANKVSAERIIMQTFFASLVSLIIPLIAVSFFMKGEIKPHEQVEEQKSTTPVWQRNLIFFMGIGSLLFVPIFKSITHLKPYMGILLGLGILWVTTEILFRKNKTGASSTRITSVLSRIDLPSILFFLGILLAVAGLQSAGQLSMLANGLDRALNGNYYIINIVIGFLSSIVDNVPLVAGAMGMYEFPMNDMFWIFLAYCAGTGGSILIIGSAAGVAVMGMEKIDFIWYMKKITPYALIGYLAGAGVFVLMDVLFFS
ncbi:MAG: sodium:proton antiporter NhaD [Bacteroidales bacterium]